MPKLTKQKFYAKNDAGVAEHLEVQVNVSTSGQFYCKVPEILKKLITTDREGRYWAKSLDELCNRIQHELHNYLTPTVTTENVIHYNIESQISFAEDSEGNIHSCGYSTDDAARVNDEMYGNINATKSSAGGYLLRIGATAMVKTTTTFGEHSEITYTRFYDGGSHLHGGTPAAELNMWNSFHLNDPPRCREIPYTDEAALFFNDLMRGMATLSRLIQNHTFDQQRLLDLIDSNTKLLPGPNDEKA